MRKPLIISRKSIYDDDKVNVRAAMADLEMWMG